MRSLQWSTSHAVFVAEIDDEHQEIIAAVSHLQKALAGGEQPRELQQRTQRLVTCVADHFAHEERLMRAARYRAMAWHKRQHENARKRVAQFVARLKKRDIAAGMELVEYLTSWLHSHTRLADRMMGAALRNHDRGLYRLTIQTGTKPADACVWVDSNGDRFDVPRPR